MSGRRTLVLGGARSGKSARALELCEPFATKTYIATAEVGDLEMEDRIRAHKTERGAVWMTIEEPLDVSGVLEQDAKPSDRGHVMLVDCLTLWISNIMHDGRSIEGEIEKLAAVVGGFRGALVMVSNEVGMGLVPDTALGRKFRDAQGRLNQRIAREVDCVEFVVAGMPMQIKP